MQFPEHSNTPFVIIEEQNHLKKVIINDAKNLNVLFSGMVLCLREALDEIERNFNNKVVVLCTPSNKVFCAGGNLKKLASGYHNDIDDWATTDLAVSHYYALIHDIGNMKNYAVSIIDGVAMGGGAMVAGLSSFRIATENSIFAMPETKIGSFVDGGASFFVSRMDRNIGFFLALTGIKLKAEDVYLCGLATHFVKSENIPTMIKELSKLGNPTYDLIDKVIQDFMVPNNHQISKTHILTESNLKTIERCFKFDTVERIIKELEAVGSKFALNARSKMLEGSPTSLAITLKNLKNGLELSFLDCLKMERHLWSLLPYEHDFQEAVQSIFINKTSQINWIPSTLEEVNMEIVNNKFFKGCLHNKRYQHIWNTVFNKQHQLRTININFGLPLKHDIVEKYEELDRDIQATVEWYALKYNHKFGIEEKVNNILQKEKPKTGVLDQQFVSKI